MTDRELMLLALDVLESVRPTIATTKNFNMKWYDHPIKTMRDRLAQPDGPVMYLDQKTMTLSKPLKHEWVGFTHEELAWLNEALNLGGRLAVIEAIEAKLKEKNT